MKKKIIAQTTARYVSTIYDKLKRNKDHQDYYYHNYVHKFAVIRQEGNGKRAIRISETMWGYITFKLAIKSGVNSLFLWGES